MATKETGKNKTEKLKLLAVYGAVALVFWCYWEIRRGRSGDGPETETVSSAEEETGGETKGEDMVYQSITQEEAKRRMDTEEGVVILDVRTREEYESGHIEGAICIPNEEIVEAPAELPDKAQTILVYCRSGKRSKQAAEKLAAFGYERVLEFGGILDWPYPDMIE